LIPHFDIPANAKQIDWNDVYRQHGKSVIQMLRPFRTMARSNPKSATITPIARERRSL